MSSLTGGRYLLRGLAGAVVEKLEQVAAVAGLTGEPAKCALGAGRGDIVRCATTACACSRAHTQRVRRATARAIATQIVQLRVARRLHARLRMLKTPSASLARKPRTVPRIVVAAALLVMPARMVAADPSPAPAARGPRIEVAFVLDATGSMGGYIDEARSRIKDIADGLASGTPKPELRFALVSFRDKGDEYVTRLDRFTGKIDEIKGALDRTKAGGGGDMPESVLEGLAVAIRQLDWSATDGHVIKLIYLVGDAPAHHYEDSPSEKGLAAEARKKGIVIHTIVCGRGMGPDGLATWDQLARLTEGRTLKLSDGARAAVARTGAAPGAPTTTLAAGIGSTTKAYSASVGIDYGSSPVVATTPLPVATPDRSGLVGAQVRWIDDPLAWSDLWAAHVSVLPDAARTTPPAVDFAKSHVLVIGGADAGLELESMHATSSGNAATLRPAAPGVRFVVVPRGGTP
jgi:Mg-chelatase subunit ChlD